MIIEKPGLYITTKRHGTVTKDIIFQVDLIEGRLTIKPYKLDRLDENIPVRKYTCEECPNKCTE